MNRTIIILVFCLAAPLLIPILSAGEGGYAGADECKACHGDVYAAWEKNVHSSVYSILEEGGAQDNANCLPCHTTGFVLAEGGKITYEEKNVTCENCHGPGSGHIKSQSKNSIDRGDRAEACLRCHTSTWTPAFDYTLYMKMGVH